MSDEDIVKAIKDWNGIDFREVNRFMIQKWYPKLNSFCKEDEIKDIFSEGILLLKININQFNFKSKLETYFISICRNLYFYDKRKKSKNPTDYIFDFSQILDYKKPFRVSNREELMKLFESSYNLLKGKCIKVLKLKHVGTDNFTIAEELGYKDKESASKTVYRCRKEWAKKVKENKELMKKIKELYYE